MPERSTQVVLPALLGYRPRTVSRRVRLMPVSYGVMTFEPTPGEQRAGGLTRGELMTPDEVAALLAVPVSTRAGLGASRVSPLARARVPSAVSALGGRALGQARTSGVAAGRDPALIACSARVGGQTLQGGAGRSGRARSREGRGRPHECRATNRRQSAARSRRPRTSCLSGPESASDWLKRYPQAVPWPILVSRRG